MANIHKPYRCRSCDAFVKISRAIYARLDGKTFKRIGWLFLPCKHVWLDKYDPDSGTMFDNSEKS